MGIRKLTLFTPFSFTGARPSMLGLLCFACLPSTLAQEPDPDIAVASMEIPKAYMPSGDGVYNRVFNRMIEGYEGDVDVSFYPSARYNRIMTNRQADCDYIATDRLDRWADEGIAASELEFIGPVNQLEVVIYVPTHAPDIETIDQLSGLNLVSDVNLLDTIHALGIEETFALQSQTQMLNLLSVNRIDAMIGYDFDLDLLSREMGLSEKVKKSTLRLGTLRDGIVCFKTERTKAFRAHLQKQFETLKQAGWFEEIFKGY